MGLWKIMGKGTNYMQTQITLKIQLQIQLQIQRQEHINDIENTITNTNTGGKYKYKYRCDLGQWERMGDGVEALVRVAPFLPHSSSLLYPAKYKNKYI